uniref:Uncharacterized protein n=1 Tax=uncultured Oceanospirillales bacterium HF4000_21D01 TaxID=723624 RepID=E7C8D4_9GAMM|nr:hypothetical protein [uncultured Oceanospirillales bacterium HF4000_21D01]
MCLRGRPEPGPLRSGNVATTRPEASQYNISYNTQRDTGLPIGDFSGGITHQGAVFELGVHHS